jgi:hypothetical protein
MSRSHHNRAYPAQINLRCTQEQYALYKAWAAELGLPLNTAIRAVLDDEAKGTIEAPEEK